MAFSLLKLLHILFAITAVGSNITYGVWQGLVVNSPEHEPFVLRGIKLLDDRVANPAYGFLLVTGLIMAFWHWSITTQWIVAAIILYVVLIGVAVAFSSPALTEQACVLDRDGHDAAACRSVSRP